MELVKLIWIAVFFLFSLTVLFVWSKLAIIARKVRAIDEIVGMSGSLEGKQAEGKQRP